MKVTIDVVRGRDKQSPTKEDIDEQIRSIDRALHGKLTGLDINLLIDTKSILCRIKDQLPSER